MHVPQVPCTRTQLYKPARLNTQLPATRKPISLHYVKVTKKDHATTAHVSSNVIKTFFINSPLVTQSDPAFTGGYKNSGAVTVIRRNIFHTLA